MLRSPRTSVARLGLGAALLILGVIALISYASINRFADGAGWVDRTHRVMLRLEELISTLEHAESRQRGFLLSGDEQLLAPYRAAEQALSKQTQELHDMTADNPEQQKSLAALQALISSRLVLLDRRIELKQSAKADLAEGARIMDHIRDLVAQMKAEEERLLAQHSRTFETDRVTATRVIVAGNALAFGFLLFALVALTREIAVRRKAEQDLRQANAFLDSVFEHMPAMVFVKEAKGLSFVRHNKANQELLGYSEAQVLGKTDYELFPKEQADFFTGKDRVVLSGRVVVDIPEEPIQTKHQGLRILHTRKIPVFDAEGQPQYLLGISQDITARKLAEQQIRELNEKLAQRASQLEATNQELESFSYSVSHDLRAPLRAIAGYSRMLNEDYRAQLDTEAKRLLDVILDNARRMTQLIDDLLHFSKLGRQSMTWAEVDMTALARNGSDALTEFPGQIAPQMVLGTLPEAHGDPALLRQVWVNLLSNAAKYSHTQPAPMIEVTARSDATDHTYCVRDNGVGFDMKYYDKLFGVFQRLHHSAEFPGTGVGLAIVQRIIARHGGRVWAEGNVGEGATFYFSLPRRAQQE